MLLKTLALYLGQAALIALVTFLFTNSVLFSSIIGFAISTIFYIYKAWSLRKKQNSAILRFLNEVKLGEKTAFDKNYGGKKTIVEFGGFKFFSFIAFERNGFYLKLPTVDKSNVYFFSPGNNSEFSNEKSADGSKYLRVFFVDSDFNIKIPWDSRFEQYC